MNQRGREETRHGKWTTDWLCAGQYDRPRPKPPKRQAGRLRQNFEKKASGARGTVRPALEEAMNYVRDGDVFVVTKLDRLARSVLELMQITQVLQEKKCDLQALDQELDTSTPTGRLIFHVLAVIGEFERELITERAREGRERVMAAGVKFGRKPKLSKRKERELLELLETVVISKEELARQFNVSRATVYRLAAKLDKDFEEQLQQA